jgi:hypothetical protein
MFLDKHGFMHVYGKMVSESFTFEILAGKKFVTMLMSTEITIKSVLQSASVKKMETLQNLLSFIFAAILRSSGGQLMK